VPKSNWANTLDECFDPRARMGRDGGTYFNARMSAVSIHAPAWGATLPVYLVATLSEILVSARKSPIPEPRSCDLAASTKKGA
ncbi:MAG: hypothetical protein ACLPSW_34530, partial [Roseiarcus sp.]